MSAILFVACQPRDICEVRDVCDMPISSLYCALQANAYGTTTLGWREAATVKHVTQPRQGKEVREVSHQVWEVEVLGEGMVKATWNLGPVKGKTWEAPSGPDIKWVGQRRCKDFCHEYGIHCNRTKNVIAEAIDALQQEGFQRVLLYGCSTFDRTAWIGPKDLN